MDGGDIIKKAERAIYFGEYVWSFLVPSANLSVPLKEYLIPLPADFIRMESGFTNDDGKGGILQLVPDSHIRSANIGDEGRIEYYSIRITSAGTYEAEFYPPPSVATTLSYRYLIEPEELSLANQWHLGTAMHSEMFLEGVLAYAEQKIGRAHV